MHTQTGEGMTVKSGGEEGMHDNHDDYNDPIEESAELNERELLTLSYWKASLAWKNIGSWARGWTVGDFIFECRRLCMDNGRLGFLADDLLDCVVKDEERVYKGEAEIFEFRHQA